MAVADVIVKTSLILASGMLAAFALHRRSAALRHWVLASTIVCAAAAPLLGQVTPSWSISLAARLTPAPLRLSQVSFRADESGPPAASLRVPATLPPPPSRDLIAGLALRAWLAGIAVNVLLLLIGLCRLHRLGSTQSDVQADIAASVTRVSATFGVCRHLVLVCGSRDAAILTWGVLRPRLVLPASAAQWSPERLDIVLAHEMAHIARADWPVQIAAQVCRAIYWFNPLFWVACAHLRHESERACDDAVVNTGVAGPAYAAELVELARTGGRHRMWLPASAIAPRASNLERRVRAMLNARIDRNPVTPRGRWASALALLAVTLPIAAFAQGGFATFSGTIVDPQDRVLPAVTITVTDASRGVTHETKTDRNGRFELIGLPAGDYVVSATSVGFRNLSDTFTLNGQSLDRTFKLHVGELQETITVISDDGSVTTARQSGNAGVKRSNQICGADLTNGVGGRLRPPHKVKDVRPGYPGVSGDVQLAATIGTDGSVTDVQIVRADRPELASAAIDAVRQWEFDSTLLNCVPIEVQMNVSLSFRQGQ